MKGHSLIMGLFDSLSDAMNSRTNKFIDDYKMKLSSSSNSFVESKWRLVKDDPDIDSRIYDATYNEMCKRGLL